MKYYIVVGFIVLAALTGPTKAAFPEMVFKVAERAGSISYIDISPSVNTVTECNCGGTGKVKFDGSAETDCVCIVKDKKCTCKKSFEFVYYGDVKKCAPCREQEKVFKFMAASGWIISNSKQSHIRKLDIGEVRQYSISTMPTFIYLKNGKEVKRVETFMTAEQLASFYNDNIKN